MAHRSGGPTLRTQKRTALMVGEGLGDEAFLRHLNLLYLLRRDGDMRITIKKAKGKGGAHVLDFTRRQCKMADYDCRLALLDTDTDWDDAQRRNATQWGIEVVEATPCLEALLLRIADTSQPPRRPGARRPSPSGSTQRRIRPACTTAISPRRCWTPHGAACRSWIN